MAIKGQLIYFPLFRLGTENSFFCRHEKKKKVFLVTYFMYTLLQSWCTYRSVIVFIINCLKYSFNLQNNFIEFLKVVNHPKNEFGGNLKEISAKRFLLLPVSKNKHQGYAGVCRDIQGIYGTYIQII